jgi:hypothetical protein
MVLKLASAGFNGFSATFDNGLNLVDFVRLSYISSKI